MLNHGSRVNAKNRERAFARVAFTGGINAKKAKERRRVL